MEQVSKRFVSWASILEPDTRAQAEQTASMPFVFPHLALMPDATSARARPSARSSPRWEP